MSSSSSLITLQEWASRSDPTLALVFTDIVNSTALINRYGNDEWLPILISHFGKAREFTQKYEGKEIKLIGDSYMAAFSTARKALNFAIDLYKDTGHFEVSIRAGIHLGEARIFDNDLYGTMVNYTSRVEHSSDESCILISDGARKDIEPALGTVNRGLNFSPVPGNFKGFNPPRQVVWRVERPDIQQSEAARQQQRAIGRRTRGRATIQVQPKTQQENPRGIRPRISPDTSIPLTRPDVEPPRLRRHLSDYLKSEKKEEQPGIGSLRRFLDDSKKEDK
jgi:class 3 adenylate cyclase